MAGRVFVGLTEDELIILRSGMKRVIDELIFEASKTHGNPRTVAHNDNPEHFKLEAKIHDAIVQIHLDQK